MPVFKVGIQLASLKMPLKQSLLTAARMGASGVEIDARSAFRPEDFSQTGLRHLRKMLNDLNLRVSAVSFQTRRGYNIMDQLPERIDATRRAMKLAYDLGSPVVINQVGRIPDPQEGPDWDLLIDVLSDLGRYGDTIGSRLTTRTGPESPDDLVRLFEALPDGAIGIDLDPGGLIIHDHSPLHAVQVLGRHILHVHARDGVRDLAAGRGLEVPLGQGSADFPALFGALEEHAYRGFVTIERTKGEDRPGEIGRAVEYLLSLDD